MKSSFQHSTSAGADVQSMSAFSSRSAKPSSVISPGLSASANSFHRWSHFILCTSGSRAAGAGSDLAFFFGFESAAASSERFDLGAVFFDFRGPMVERTI